MNMLFEILVPTLYGDNLKPIRTRHHKKWDERVQAITGGMTGRYKCAIYGGNATTATTYLQGTTEITNPTSGWYSFPFVNMPVTVTNGQYYYLAVWGNASPAAVYYTTGTGTTIWQDKAYGNWPNPFVSGGTFTGTYCIYATALTNQPPITNTYASVTLAWDASPDASVTGYRIYYGPVSGGYTNSINVGPPLTMTMTNLTRGSTYFFAATAYDGSGLESAFSNEVAYTPPLTSRPGVVESVRIPGP